MGKHIKETLEKGEFVSSDIMNSLVLDTIRNSNGFILDGYPRNIEQVGMLDVKIDKVIFIDLPYRTCIERIRNRQEGRSDDVDGISEKRLNIYKAVTFPVVEIYSKRGLVAEIDGNKDKEAVFEEIKKKLGI